MNVKNICPIKSKGVLFGSLNQRILLLTEVRKNLITHLLRREHNEKAFI